MRNGNRPVFFALQQSAVRGDLVVERDLDVHEGGVLPELAGHLVPQPRQLLLQRRQVLGVARALRLQLAFQLAATVLWGNLLLNELSTMVRFLKIMTSSMRREFQV